MAANPNHIRVTILGSGTCVPSLKRSSCAVLIEAGHSKTLLDCGPGTIHRLLDADTTIFDLSHIFLSHFHPDHSSELVPLIFATKYGTGSQRRTPLRIHAGYGLVTFYQRLQGAYGHWIELPDDQLALIEMGSHARDEIQYPDFTVETVPVEHNDESLAYRICGPNGQSVVYSGDTDYCDDLIRLARVADLFICESALPDKLKAEGHLTPSLAGKIAAKAGVRHLVLTHFYPACEQVNIVSQCRKTYDGPLTLAEDLMRFEI